MVEAPPRRPLAAVTHLPAPWSTPRRRRHLRAPMVEAIGAYQAAGTRPFSTPGHKLGTAAPTELRNLLGVDFFAADIWLNGVEYEISLNAAQALAADAWGADHAFFLGNGSSSGNQAIALASLAPGDEVVVARDLHTSLLTGLILTGARPIYLQPRLHPTLGFALGIEPAAVAAALDAHPQAKVVALVSPTYWGVATDLAGVIAAAHARDVPVYVDEAWGAHLPFHPALPPAAFACGADGAVTSPHKLLSGVSQAALLTLKGTRLDPRRVEAAVRMMQTTSPLLPIWASLDSCRRQMALSGEELLERTLGLASAARRRLRAAPGLTVLDAELLGLPAARYDPTRLVIDVQGLGMTGFEAERRLRARFATAPEMSDLTSVVCLVTIGDTAGGIDRLVDSFVALAAEASSRSRLAQSSGIPRLAAAATGAGEQVLSPREAYFAPSRAVPLADAVGEVAAELVVPYPPGIPVLAPGEIVTAEKATYLAVIVASGGLIRGAADPRLGTVRVVVAAR